MIYQQAIKKTKEYPLIITIGDESFYKEQVLKRVLADNPEAELQVFDAEIDPISEIEESLKDIDLFSSDKIIKIKNFTKWKNFEKQLNSKHKIILEDSKLGTAKKFDDLKEKALIVECNKPKPWEEKEDFCIKIKSLLNSKNYSIDEEAAEYIFCQIGYNLYCLMQELQKLILYKQESRHITLTDVKEICLEGIYYNVFDIIDFLIDNKKKEALESLNRIFKYESSPAILLINLWYSHFENLLYLKNCDNLEGKTFLKMSPFIINKKLRPQANKVSEKKLVYSLNFLVHLDYNIRKGCQEPRYFLEKFIIDF